MVSTRFIVVLSTALLALAIPHSKRDAVTVENDIRNNITPDTNKLASDVNAFPGSGLTGALGIHTDATNLATAVNSATTDAGATTAPVSEADGQTILGLVQGLEPTILSTLTAIVNKKASFQALPVAGIPALVLQDLKTLNTSVINFSNGLIRIAPADLVPTGTTIRNAVASAFASAIAAYS